MHLSPAHTSTVRYNIPVVYFMPSSNLVLSTIIAASINRVSVLVHRCFVYKLFRLLISAPPTFHTWCPRVPSATQTMYHTVFDCCIKWRILNFIRELSTKCFIHLGTCLNLIWVLKKYKEVHMRQPSLLEFDNKHVCYLFTKTLHMSIYLIKTFLLSSKTRATRSVRSVASWSVAKLWETAFLILSCGAAILSVIPSSKKEEF